MTSVLLTIDTELSAALHKRGVSLDENIARSILGTVPDGNVGIAFQIERFRQHGLKAIFFVEALSASVFGLDVLRRVIDPILSSGNDVQLHIHSEWLQWFDRDPVGGRRGGNMANFDFADQCTLLEIGIENLTKAGAPVPVAFRAGNYGANNDTLRALSTLEIAIDSSYNLPYAGVQSSINTHSPILDPLRLEGVVEIPISVFVDGRNQCRPAQLCAISSSEMRLVLEQSVVQRRRTVVIVSHSFELLRRDRLGRNHIVTRRFDRLCEMLNDMRSSAPTCGIADLDLNDITTPSKNLEPLRSTTWHTAARMLQQAIGTVVFG